VAVGLCPKAHLYAALLHTEILEPDFVDDFLRDDAEGLLDLLIGKIPEDGSREKNAHH
jgi:hypothetical protein